MKFPADSAIRDEHGRAAAKSSSRGRESTEHRPSVIRNARSGDVPAREFDVTTTWLDDDQSSAIIRGLAPTAIRPCPIGAYSARRLAAAAVALFVVISAIAANNPLAAQEAAKKPEPAKSATTKPASPLNDELLKGLGGDPLDEQAPPVDPGKVIEPNTAKPTGKPTSKRIGDPLDDELLKGLDDVESAPAEGDDSDPFVRVNRQMRKVESLIAQRKFDPGTRQLQQKIVHDLEELIKNMQQQKSSSPSSESKSQQQTASRDKVKQPGGEKGKSGAQDSDQPAKESSEQLRQRKAQQAALDQMQDLLGKGVWGQLPQKARDQMLQSSSDQFLPKYQLLIEEYFKAIANQGQNKP